MKICVGTLYMYIYIYQFVEINTLNDIYQEIDII